jgi:hypothetical protein
MSHKMRALQYIVLRFFASQAIPRLSLIYDLHFPGILQTMHMPWPDENSQSGGADGEVLMAEIKELQKR